MRFAILCLLAAIVFPSLSRGQAPVFEIIPAERWIKIPPEGLDDDRLDVRQLGRQLDIYVS